ncbi:MAG: DegT/DnrJ/EryC1/StrS family aminotransferase [Candidatus Limnocylindria bacterium]
MTTIPERQLRSVPLAQPDIGPDEIALVNEVLRSDVLSMGPFTEEFESTLAAAVGRRFGIACSSGTAGLHMAVVALGLHDGDEVITTPFSFVASANCLLYERVTPRFVDIEEETLGLDPTQVESAIGLRTRAILPVDVFGHPCRMDDLQEIADRRDLRLIEDACEAIGSTLNGRPVGSFGDASVFAFYPNKQITTGEGGMVVTDDPELASVMRSLRNQGRDEDGIWLRHVRLGFNYRIDELSAALGLAQMRRLDQLRRGRDRVATAYAQGLADIDWLTLPAARPGATVDWFVYVVRVGGGLNRDLLIEQLAARGVPSRPYFSPIHLQPYYRERLGHMEGDFPVTERVAAETLALPFSSRLPLDDVARVVEALRSAAAEQRSR